MKKTLSFDKPLFLLDGSSRDLSYHVAEIIFCTKASLLVSTKIIVNNNIKKNKYFNQDIISQTENQLFEVLIDENTQCYAEDFDNHKLGHFDKKYFNNFLYNSDKNTYDTNLKADNFQIAKINKNCDLTLLQEWFDKVNKNINT